MTTIAANATMMVSDSMASDSDQKWVALKIERIGATLAGTAGGVADGELFYAWLRRGKRGKKPKVGSDFYALVLTEAGLYTYDADMQPSRIEGMFAIGSGAKAARGAYLAGADLFRAVAIACEVDSGSSLPLQCHYLNAEHEGSTCD